MPVPGVEIERRLAAFQATLRAEGIDAALVVQNADLYYLAGTVQQSHFWCRPRARRAVHAQAVARAREESPLTIAELPSLRRLGELSPSAAAARPASWGSSSTCCRSGSSAATRACFPGARFVDVGAQLVAQRAVKSPWEVARIAAAAALADEVFAASPSCCARA